MARLRVVDRQTRVMGADGTPNTWQVRMCWVQLYLLRKRVTRLERATFSLGS